MDEKQKKLIKLAKFMDWDVKNHGKGLISYIIDNRRVFMKNHKGEYTWDPIERINDTWMLIERAHEIWRASVTDAANGWAGYSDAAGDIDGGVSAEWAHGHGRGRDQ